MYSNSTVFLKFNCGLYGLCTHPETNPNIALITYLNIRCGNACLPDFRNLCDIVNVGWKRKYIDRRTKRFNICTKPTLFSAQMNGQ